MMTTTLYDTLYWAWVVTEVVVYLRTRTKRSSGEVQDRGSMLVLWVTIILALTISAWIGAAHPLPMFGAAHWVQSLSLAVFAAGLGIRWAAIASLGKSFSVNVAIHATQTLRTTGLFNVVRHPSYTGLVLIFLAIALFPANWTYFWIVLLPTTTALLYRIHVEERALSGAFGSEYRDYSTRTKRLIPFIY